MYKKINLFITGDLHIGKSTILKNILTALNKDYCGYLSMCSEKTKGFFTVHMCSNNEPAIFKIENCIAECEASGKVMPHLEVLNALGHKIINEQRKNIFVIDELGFIEQGSLPFQKAIIERLDSEDTVIGVIKKQSVPWLEPIKKRKDVVILEITEENRTEITDDAVKIILKNIL